MTENNNLIKLWGNNEKRQAFLEAYKDFGEWFRVPELDLVFYRYTLPSGDIIIAMEHKQITYHSSSKGDWKSGVRYYLQGKNEPFTPYSNRSLWNVADLLKDAKVKLQQKSKKV